MRRLIQIIILIAGTLIAEAAVTATVSDQERFQLWNDCKGLHLQIVVKPPVLIEQIGISKERIENHLRDKLRAERIYVTETLPSGNMVFFLFLKGEVKTKTVANHEYKNIAYGIMGGFWKQFPELEHPTITFFDFGAGYRTNPDPRSIEAVAVSYGRLFIDNYLRVNAAACKNSN